MCGTKAGDGGLLNTGKNNPLGWIKFLQQQHEPFILSILCCLFAKFVIWKRIACIMYQIISHWLSFSLEFLFLINTQTIALNISISPGELS